jgi:HD-GYP domain-containing protein (c-di-GMP phosphodiesterase class II)
MPVLVACAELKVGMRLAEAFTLHGRVMLPGGRVLNEETLSILQEKYPTITLKIGDPVLDSIAEFEDDSREREVAAKVTSTISSCVAKVQDRFSTHTNVSALDYNAIKSAAQDVMEYLAKNPVSAALLTRSFDKETYLSEHAGNVFYLALVLGSAVRDYVYRERARQTRSSSLNADVGFNLLPLALGSMFIDLGMVPLKHLFTKTDPLTAEEKEQIREHPLTGAAMLPDNLPAGVKMVVKTHHENFDGSGYPGGLDGPSLHVFTRIVRIVDAYDAATATHVYRNAKSPARAMWEIGAGPLRKFYDPVLTKMFMSLIQPFPIGAKVKLADGRIAVVCKYNRKNPFRPHGIIAFDVTGERLPDNQLQGPVILGDEPNTQLKEFAGEDLSFIYDMDPTAAEPRPFDSIFEAGYP